MKETDEAPFVRPEGSRMYCLRERTGRMFHWAMPDGDRKAPLLFVTKKDAEHFRKSVIHSTAWKIKMTEKVTPCWIYQEDGHRDGEGQLRWEGKLDFASIRTQGFQHESLTPEAEALCKELYYDFGRFCYPTYEQWERGFLYNRHPEWELEVYKDIGKAFHKWEGDHPDATAKDKGEAVAMLSVVSLGDKVPEMAKYYDGKILPFVCEPTKSKQYEFHLHASELLKRTMPEERIRQLAHEWTDRAMKREAERTNVVWTQWGDVIVHCDFENFQILMGLAREVEDDRQGGD